MWHLDVVENCKFWIDKSIRLQQPLSIKTAASFYSKLKKYISYVNLECIENDLSTGFINIEAFLSDRKMAIKK